MEPARVSRYDTPHFFYRCYDILPNSPYRLSFHSNRISYGGPSIHHHQRDRKPSNHFNRNSKVKYKCVICSIGYVFSDKRQFCGAHLI